MPSPPSPAAQVRYQERLWPSPGIWAAAVALGAALGVVPAPVSGTAGVVVAVIGVIGLVAWLWIATPQLTVTDQEFRAGRAHLPLALVETVEQLDADQMRQARGRTLDARAYLCIRGWLPAGARVILQDPDDPTPYWLISSRRPEALVAAVHAGITRSR